MTIKDFIGSAFYEPAGQSIFGKQDDGDQRIADIRGWGAIQNLFIIPGTSGMIDSAAAAKFQDELGQFIADAINEKLKTL